jgi:hypothetical protein
MNKFIHDRLVLDLEKQSGDCAKGRSTKQSDRSGCLIPLDGDGYVILP